MSHHLLAPSGVARGAGDATNQLNRAE